ncbi:MAG: hypothetical protein ACM3NO_02120 [Deltaproteobacteria bacterium]
MKTFFRDTIRCTSVLMFAAALFAAMPLRAVEWETLFTAQDVRDHLNTEKGRAEALEFCRRMGISKVYIESFRGYQADAETLKTARDYFRDAGLKVSGCVTTVNLGKPSTGWNIAACYTNRANQQHLASVFKFTAGIFDEIMIDDFFFTDCECSECAAAKGNQSWPQYREKLMLQMSRDNVLGAARSVNPNVKIILKYPQWYDNFHNRGYSVDKETALYDRIWVGTELRDPSSDEWGHKQQYEGFWLYRWLSDVGGAKTGGGWFDPFGTDPITYMDQAYISVLAGAPEVFLFHYGSLISPQYQAQAETFAKHRTELEELAKYVGNWSGIAAYKPPSSDPGNGSYIFDEIGMLGIPLLPTAEFPAKSRAALFTYHALGDSEFVPQLVEFLKSGKTAFVREQLAHELNLDPRLVPDNKIALPKGKLLATFAEGSGKIIVFSDSLAKLTYVDNQNRVAQPSDAEREALDKLRHAVADFTVTSYDAPPRVAIFPMGGRAAVANFTELPIAIRLTALSGMSSRYQKVFATAGAWLASDGLTIHLPPHGMMVVE